VPPIPPANSKTYAPALAGEDLGASLPPQVALTVTEKAGLQKNWGRFYLPPLGAAYVNEFGRPTDAAITAIADATETMYDGWRTDGTPAVVYLEALPERSPTAEDPRYRTKGTFAARGASATEVERITVDNVFDVIRSRRWERSTNRQERTVSS
jgi:hypothetical protein